MLIIPCPYCGPRDEIEFVCGGEEHIARPLAENTITDAEFAEYLFILVKVGPCRFDSIVNLFGKVIVEGEAGAVRAMDLHPGSDYLMVLKTMPVLVEKTA